MADRKDDFEHLPEEGFVPRAMTEIPGYGVSHGVLLCDDRAFEPFEKVESLLER
jgi:hypothetical protein